MPTNQSPVTAVWNAFEIVRSLEVKIETGDKTWSGSVDPCWVSVSPYRTSYVFPPPARNQSTKVSIDVPDPVTIEILRWVGVGMVYKPHPIATDEWYCGGVTVIVNNYLEQRFEPDMWISNPNNNYNPAWSHHLVESAWTLGPDPSPPGYDPGQSIPSPSQTSQLIWKILGDFHNWLLGKTSTFPANRYYEEFAKNVKEHEWVLIKSTAAERAKSIVPPVIAPAISYLFVAHVLSIYASAFFACRSIVDASERNAMRHVVWQIRLTQEYGQTFAEQLAEAHELGDNSSPEDERVDRLNNGVAQQIALQNPTGDALTLAQQAWNAGQLHSYSDKWPGDQL